MAGKAGRSGRKSKREDEELLGELKDALEEAPPKRFVDAGKKTVRDALKKKRDQS